MLNRITMTGRLVADPELRRTQSGVSVTSFRIANDRDMARARRKRRTFSMSWPGDPPLSLSASISPRGA